MILAGFHSTFTIPLIASLTENLNDISLRYNTTSSRPEWKERGADTWNPFSSGAIDLMTCIYFNSTSGASRVYACNEDGSCYNNSAYAGSLASFITDVNAHNDMIDISGSYEFSITVEFKKSGYYIIGAGEVTNYTAGQTLANQDIRSGITYLYLGETSPFPIALVPAMTSNTTPSGVCFSSGAEASRPEWYAFDQNLTTMFHSSRNTAPFFVGYNLPSARKAEKVTMTVAGYPASGQTCPARTFTIQGSNNNTSWTELGTISVVATSVSGEEQNVESSFSNNTAYTYYRLYCDEAVHIGDTWSWQFIAIQFYSYE